MGEHGDSEVSVWSLANIAGMRLAEFSAATGIPCRQSNIDEIFRNMRDAAYQIIQRKRHTYYAVAAGLFRIMEAILRVRTRCCLYPAWCRTTLVSATFASACLQW